jgi:hypothetical protein
MVMVPTYYRPGEIKFGTSPSLELSMVVYIMLFFSLAMVLLGLCGLSRRVSRLKRRATRKHDVDTAITQPPPTNGLQFTKHDSVAGRSLDGDLAAADAVSSSSSIPPGAAVKHPVIHTVSLMDRRVSSTASFRVLDKQCQLICFTTYCQVMRRRTVTIVEQEEGAEEVKQGEEEGGRETGDDPDDAFLAVLLTNETFVIQ